MDDYDRVALNWELLEYSCKCTDPDLFNALQATFRNEGKDLTLNLYAWCINQMKKDYITGDLTHKKLMEHVKGEAALRCNLFNLKTPKPKVLASSAYGSQPLVRKMEASLEVQGGLFYLKTTYSVDFAKGNHIGWTYRLPIEGTHWQAAPTEDSDQFWEGFTVPSATHLPHSFEGSLQSPSTGTENTNAYTPASSTTTLMNFGHESSAGDPAYSSSQYTQHTKVGCTPS